MVEGCGYGVVVRWRELRARTTADMYRYTVHGPEFGVKLGLGAV